MAIGVDRLAEEGDLPYTVAGKLLSFGEQLGRRAAALAARAATG